MNVTRKGKFYFWALLITGALLAVFIVWNIGGVLVAPANHAIGPPPPQQAVQAVEFASASGSQIHGWFIAGQPGRGAVVLMHGVHSDRTSLIPRAEFLSRAGYAVLLFDFQAHGESLGQHITFGFLESRDATAAVNFVHQNLPGEKVGVIGISLGAAAAQLAVPPLPVEAMILESSFPTIYHATEDRLVVRLGPLGRLATPLLLCQLRPRLGIGLDDLNPLRHASQIFVPKFFLAGTKDPLTTIEESRSLFAAAAQPKQAWWVEGAGHQDLHAFAKSDYETRVLSFLAAHLR